MALNTPHNVTLSEAQISVILNSLDHTLDRWEQSGYYCEEDQKVIDSVYETLEGSFTTPYLVVSFLLFLSYHNTYQLSPLKC